MSPDPDRQPDGETGPGEIRHTASSDDLGAEPFPLFAPGSRDDDFGLMSPDDRGIPLGSIDPNEVRAGHGTAEFLAEIDTAPAPLPPRPPEDQDDEDEPEPSTSWPMVVLGSYASAVTLALIWVLLTRPATSPADPSPALPGPAFPPLSVERETDDVRGRKVEPISAIPEDRVARIGETLRVGSLEITPQDAVSQSVILRRLDLAGRGVETRKPGTIILRLKLSNVSNDLAFAPLDPGFVRQGGTDDLDAFAETPQGERIYFYPLAIASELSILGQEFGELRPGESRVVPIATAPAAPSIAPSSLSWRLRLRTGLDRVETIGVAPAGRGATQPK